MKPWVWMLLGALALIYVLVPAAVAVVAVMFRLLLLMIGVAIELVPFILAAVVIGAIVKCISKPDTKNKN